MTSRRRFLASVGAAAAGAASSALGATAMPGVPGKDRKQAHIAITLDLEMSRNFPTWEQTHWDYEKGNLDEATKRYAVEAARRVKAAGGRLHFFLVGRVLEQASVAWLEELVREGHPIGNHTYDHVNVTAGRIEDVQFRFQRAPWLVDGKTPQQVIEENIRITELALKARLGIAPAGFRTPGGFASGLTERPDVQAMLLKQGYKWVSSQYAPHALGEVGREPGVDAYAAIIKAQEKAQPYRYSSGLVEVPMSAPSDITVFRGGRWELDWFLRGVRAGVEWAIEQGGVFDFLGHPSCLVVKDPEFKAIDLILETVRRAGERAAVVPLGEVARRVA